MLESWNNIFSGRDIAVQFLICVTESLCSASLYEVSDGNSIDDSGAAPSEPAEKDRNFSSDGKPALPFSEVRKDQGSRFPSPSVQYLWEFGSLSHFIEDRKVSVHIRAE